ncbi:glycosyltransferase family 9 protein [Anaeromusa sp.]|uniref:glycosyltransferase family 9 protein n=1 Tax=Anaeromusa sp. TaxID=1872520 RepID=UPI00262D8CA8|nr:glycosyltransferase family 9 protein [Anaeromusa sp.]MDD3157100.1 glycosyltransferase family 9 protein [Anaeromusa sp.]
MKEKEIQEQYLQWCSQMQTNTQGALEKLRQTMAPALYAEQSDSAMAVKLEEVKRIVIIRLDEIGDVTLMSGMLRELRRNAPQARITLVVKNGVCDLVRCCPYIDEVLGFDSGELLKQGGVMKVLQEMGEFCAHRFWGQQIDLCLVPRYDFDRYFATILAYVSGAKRRVGFSEKATPWKASKNKGFDQLLTDVVPVGRLAHEAEHNYAMLRFLGGSVQKAALELWVEEAAKRWALALLDQYRQHDRIVLSLGPGRSRRTWPVERMIEVDNRLHELGKKVVFVLLGTKEELENAELFQRQSACEVLNLVGKTTLQQTGAVLQQCQMYLGRNTGILHMAAAANLKIVEISCYPQVASSWGIDSPVRFRAWCEHRILLQPNVAMEPCKNVCEKNEPHCILQVTEEQVLNALTLFLEN